MKLNFNKENILLIPTFLLSIILWSFLNFSLMKLFFEINNELFFLLIIYSLGCSLFWIYYYINSGILLSFREIFFSYLLICLFVFTFHKIYNAVFLLKVQANYDNNVLYIFAVSLIPAVILFFIGKLIFNAIKPV